MKKRKKNNIKFSKLIIFGSLFLFAVIIARVSQLALSTTVDGISLNQLASSRTTRTEVLPARRGGIFSSDGEVLAQNVSSYRLIAYLSESRTDNPKRPQHVVDKEKTAEALAPILGMEPGEVLNFLSKENIYQTEFGVNGRNLSELTKREIEDLGLPGLGFVESYRRYYPKGSFLSYTLGYAKTTNEEVEGKEKELIKGEMGLELYFDKILSGEDGYRTFQKDLRGYQIADTPEVRKDAVEGRDIHLTIDSNIQFFVEQALNNAANFGHEWFHMTVADAKTGKILATATSPSFDPNKRDMVNFLDTMISIPYEPGSTMKTFTYMAAMENGVYDGNATFRSGTYLTSDGTEIGDWNRAGFGTITYDKGYTLSSNVGIINLINNNMNAMMLRSYFRKLGFGKKTGITLPNESYGNLEFKYETEVFNAGFGQGITTTPIQNIQALTSLTNDGMLLKPYIIDKIVDSDTGEIISTGERRELERVASTSTVQKILQLMDATVNEPGNTGSHYRIDNNMLIGKTGTAQIANPNGGGYLPGKEQVIASFSGFYPKNDPEIIIYASVKKPTAGAQSSISTAVKYVVNNVSKYYGHDHVEEETKIIEYKLPSFVNQGFDQAKTNLDTEGIPVVVLGEGSKVIRQYPKANNVVTNKDTVYLITNDPNLTVPNVVGLSSKVARELLLTMGVKVKLENRGYVTEQNIPEGTPIGPDMEVTLMLHPKFEI